ncbi:MAG: arsenite methyltransferase [Actinomycetota bacterium]|nr:arsenite methyltransferase [Actinomycetota bacterium]
MAEQLTSPEEIKEAVRERYAAAADQAAGDRASCCAPAEGSCCGTSALAEQEREVFGASQYGEGERGEVPEAARLASLGCGNPTAVAELREDETVLDLGSGGGIDVLLSARRVGPSGFAYGLDMTDEMLALARRNAEEAGTENVEFLRGEIEAIPLPAASVDVVISNCVVNLSADKGQVLGEVARVLRPGGRLGITDVVADPDMDEATRRDMEAFTGCIAGALTREEYETGLRAAGLVDIEVRETHRVHPKAGSSIVRARKPSACCAPVEHETCCEPAAKTACCDAAVRGSSCGCR